LTKVVAALEEWDSSIEAIRCRYRLEFPYHSDPKTHAIQSSRTGIEEWGETSDGKRYLITERYSSDRALVSKQQYTFDGETGWTATYDLKEDTIKSLTKTPEFNFGPNSERCEVLRVVRFYGRPIYWHFRQGLVTANGRVKENGVDLLRFRIAKFPHLPVVSFQHAFVLDPAHDYLPKRVELLYRNPDAAGDDATAGWRSSMAHSVLAFDRRSDGRWCPGKVELVMYERDGRLHLRTLMDVEKFEVNEPIPDEMFRPQEVAHVGTPIFAGTAIAPVAFVGGDEGRRVYEERHPREATASSPAPPTGPLADATPHRAVWPSIVFGSFAAGFLILALWLKRKVSS
jgi:hypothetical protein